MVSALSNLSSVFIFFAAILAAVGAYIAAKSHDKIQTELTTSQMRIEAQNFEISQLASRIVDLSSSNIELTRRIEFLNTGGDSFALISLTRTEERNILSVVVEHIGEFPIHNMQIRIVDMDLLRHISQYSFDAVTRNVFQIQNLPPRYASLLNFGIEYIKGSTREFNIFFDARNGGWIQNLIITSGENGQLKQSTRVTRAINGENQIILERH